MLITTPNSFPIWTAEIIIPSEELGIILYKYAIKSNQNFIWEEGTDRILDLTRFSEIIIEE
jgi:hypothetical protein